MGLKGFAILFMISTVGAISHCPARPGIKNNSSVLKARRAALAVAPLSACVIASSISRNWTCNHQDHKASEWKAGMFQLLSVLQGAAKEAPQLSTEIPKTPPSKGKSVRGQDNTEHFVWNSLNFFVCVHCTFMCHTEMLMWEAPLSCESLHYKSHITHQYFYWGKKPACPQCTNSIPVHICPWYSKLSMQWGVEGLEWP